MTAPDVPSADSAVARQAGGATSWCQTPRRNRVGGALPLCQTP
jgi:hypothetical protein